MAVTANFFADITGENHTVKNTCNIPVTESVCHLGTCKLRNTIFLKQVCGIDSTPCGLVVSPTVKRLGPLVLLKSIDSGSLLLSSASK